MEELKRLIRRFSPIALAWRVILNKIQSKADLACRNALPSSAGVDCVMCYGEEESIPHLFFGCHMAWGVWAKIFRWLGVIPVLPTEARGHFLQFGHCSSGGSASARVIFMIWIAVIGSIWYYQNYAMFRDEAVEVEMVVELTQFKSWLWQKAFNRDK